MVFTKRLYNLRLCKAAILIAFLLGLQTLATGKSLGKTTSHLSLTKAGAVESLIAANPFPSFETNLLTPAHDSEIHVSASGNNSSGNSFAFLFCLEGKNTFEDERNIQKQPIVLGSGNTTLYNSGFTANVFSDLYSAYLNNWSLTLLATVVFLH